MLKSDLKYYIYRQEILKKFLENSEDFSLKNISDTFKELKEKNAILRKKSQELKEKIDHQNEAIKKFINK